MQYETKTNKSTHSEMGRVWQNPIQRTVRTAQLSVLMTVHSFSTQYNTEQNIEHYQAVTKPINWGHKTAHGLLSSTHCCHSEWIQKVKYVVHSTLLQHSANTQSAISWTAGGWANPGTVFCSC